MRFVFRTMSLAGLVFAAGCAADVPQFPLAAGHPAYPEAPEGAFVPPPSALRSSDAEPPVVKEDRAAGAARKPTHDHSTMHHHQHGHGGHAR